MKKNVLMMLAGAALLCACQPSSKNITISGTLTGVESDTLLVTHAALPTVSGGSSATKLDTVALLDGKFSLTLECDTLPIQAVIFAKPAGNKMLNMTQNIRIVAFPNDALTVNGSLEDYKVEGSDFYASLNEAEKAWQPTIDSLQTILKKHSNIDPTDLPEDSTITAQIQALGQRGDGSAHRLYSPTSGRGCLRFPGLPIRKPDGRSPVPAGRQSQKRRILRILPIFGCTSEKGKGP